MNLQLAIERPSLIICWLNIAIECKLHRPIRTLQHWSQAKVLRIHVPKLVQDRECPRLDLRWCTNSLLDKYGCTDVDVIVTEDVGALSNLDSLIQAP